MSRIDDIKERIENYKSEYLPYFNSNGDMREWHSMFEDIQYLISRLETAEYSLELSLKFIDNTDKEMLSLVKSLKRTDESEES